MTQHSTIPIEYYQDSLLLSLFDKDSNEYHTALKNLQSLKSRKIALIGVGGVGSVCAHSLIRSGISNLKIIDGDVVEKSNLGRQWYFEKDISTPKVSALEQQLKLIQPNCQINTYSQFLTKESAHSLLKDVDFIIDCSDNLKTRRIINAYCLQNNKLWIYSGAQGFQSNLCIFDYSQTTTTTPREDKSQNSNPYPQNDIFSKLITSTHEEQANCSSGVIISSTSITAQFIINELILYIITQNTSLQRNCFELLKINLINSTIFKAKVK